MTSEISENDLKEKYTNKLSNKLEYIEKLSMCINSKELLKNLCDIHDAVKTIWDPNERLIKNFTDHGIEHSDRVAHNILCLLKAKNISLSEKEAYKLLASIYLHDIGMQCDIKENSIIKKAEDYYNKADHAEEEIFKINYTARDFSDYDYYEQKEIRKNHHLLSAAWIDLLREDGNGSIIHKAAKNIPEDCIEDIIDICMYHSKLELKSEAFEDPRIFLLAILLRFGDELDIAKERVSPYMYQTFRVATENSKHWWLHQHTEINYSELERGRVVLTYYLNSEDMRNNSHIIKNYYHFNFKIKNEKIAEELGIQIEPIIIKDSSKYEKMQPELIKELAEYKYNVEESSVKRAKFEMQRLPKEMDAHDEKNYSPFYSITFDIPDNWMIGPPSKNEGNIGIKLTNKSSHITLNVINIEGHGIPQILTRKLLKDNWKERYNNGSFSWSVNTNIGEHYIYYILFSNDFWTGQFSVGTGLKPIKPDCVEYPYYAIKYNFGMPNEWIIAWTKPEYENKIVAIHAIFNEDYKCRDVKIGGSGGPTNKMQLPLYDILENIKIVVHETT
jgi:hypothetical protein